IGELAQLGVSYGEEGHGKRPRQFFGRARALIEDALDTIALDQRDGISARIDAAGDRKWHPGRIALVFGETEGVLSRAPENGAVEFTGTAPSD
ncbi:hypothetical protein, partial [Streptomyces brasiliscabiei]|uniref:hypothetical protein n=1 Tax=Streptomyces brasiliscabiei TaxID=2736302 RepID=UPI003014C6B3